MENSKPDHSFYQNFSTYKYPDLEEMILKAETPEERKFWVALCNCYFSIHQERVMREKPF